MWTPSLLTNRRWSRKYFQGREFGNQEIEANFHFEKKIAGMTVDFSPVMKTLYFFILNVGDVLTRSSCG